MARVGNAACSGCWVGRAVVFGPLLAVLWVWRVALCSCWSRAARLLGLRHLRWPAGSFASWCPRPDCPRVLVWPRLVLFWEPGCRLPPRGWVGSPSLLFSCGFSGSGPPLAWLPASCRACPWGRMDSSSAPVRRATALIGGPPCHIYRLPKAPEATSRAP